MKIGNLDISSFKVGGADCSIYLGDTKLYPSEEPTPTPTYHWVSYSEGDTIPSNDVYNTYGFKIQTQTLLDIFNNGEQFSISFYSEEKDQLFHPVSNIEFAFPYDGEIFFAIDEESQEISYDPERDEYLEIIFSDYGVNYNYNVFELHYGEEGDTITVYDFPFGMDLYEEETPTPQTLQWVTFNNGDTIPSDLDIYGTKGNANDLSNAIVGWFTLSRRNVEININGCYSDTVSMDDNVELIFSGLGTCSDYYNLEVEQFVGGGSIQLYIYA